MLLSFRDDAGRKSKHKWKWSDTIELTARSILEVNLSFNKKQISKFLARKFLIEHPSTFHLSVVAVLQQENRKLAGENLILQQQHEPFL